MNKTAEDTFQAFQVRFPVELHAQAKDLTGQQGVSLNTFVIAAVEATVHLLTIGHQSEAWDAAVSASSGEGLGSSSPADIPGAKDDVVISPFSLPVSAVGVVDAGTGMVSPLTCEHPVSARLGTKCLRCGTYPV